MNFTNLIAASLFLVFLKIPRLMPATMLVTGRPPAGSVAGSGTGATPMSSGFIPNCRTEPWAACQKTIEVVPVAKSFSASVPFEYWASLGFTILSVCMKSRYCLIAATFCGVLNVAFPAESKNDTPCCLQRQRPMVRRRELLGVDHELVPGLRRAADARGLELTLVVVQPVSDAVERDGHGGLTSDAGSRHGAGEEPRLAADRGQRRVVKWEKRSRRLDRRRPGVADIDDVRPLSRGGRREDLVQQV